MVEPQLFISLFFVVSGLGKLLHNLPSATVPIFEEDIRSYFWATNRDMYGSACKHTLILASIASGCVRGKCALFVWWMTMFMDGIRYPYPDTTNPRELESRKQRWLVHEVVTLILILSLLSGEPTTFCFQVVMEMIIGLIVFVVGYYKKCQLDDFIYYELAVINHRAAFERDYKITCPEYKYRIIQWIGFAILSGNQIVSCFVFDWSCFLVLSAFDRHRQLARVFPSFTRNKTALLENI